MLNRNDPLIGAVQEVMKKNQAERDAIKAVNEKFGVVDRRALPHEQQANWDAAYNKVISEGVEVLNEELSPKQKQLAAIAGDKRKIDSPDLAAARAGKASHIEEESATAASKKAEKGTKWKVKSRNWDRDGSEVELRQGKRVKMKGTYDRNASMFTMSKTKKGKFDPKSKAKDYDDAKDILKTVKESEQIDEVAPPGREKQVKALKGKVGKKSAFAIAWASYNKKKGK